MMKPYITEWYFKFEPENLLRGNVRIEPDGCQKGKYTVGWQRWICTGDHASSGHYKDYHQITTYDTYEEAVIAMEEQYPMKKKVILEGLDRSPFDFHSYGGKI